MYISIRLEFIESLFLSMATRMVCKVSFILQATLSHCVPLPLGLLLHLDLYYLFINFVSYHFLLTF